MKFAVFRELKRVNNLQSLKKSIVKEKASNYLPSIVQFPF
jgi:hypothetical protein